MKTKKFVLLTLVFIGQLLYAEESFSHSCKLSFKVKLPFINEMINNENLLLDYLQDEGLQDRYIKGEHFVEPELIGEYIEGQVLNQNRDMRYRRVYKFYEEFFINESLDQFQVNRNSKLIELNQAGNEIYFYTGDRADYLFSFPSKSVLVFHLAVSEDEDFYNKVNGYEAHINLDKQLTSVIIANQNKYREGDAEKNHEKNMKLYKKMVQQNPNKPNQKVITESPELKEADIFDFSLEISIVDEDIDISLTCGQRNS